MGLTPLEVLATPAWGLHAKETGQRSDAPAAPLITLHANLHASRQFWLATKPLMRRVCICLVAFFLAVACFVGLLAVCDSLILEPDLCDSRPGLRNVRDKLAAVMMCPYPSASSSSFPRHNRTSEYFLPVYVLFQAIAAPCAFPAHSYYSVATPVCADGSVVETSTIQ